MANGVAQCDNKQGGTSEKSRTRSQGIYKRNVESAGKLINKG